MHPSGHANLPVTVNTIQGQASDELPHSVLQVTAITRANGKKAFRLYVSTESAYAPNGDSGTFIFSKNGELVAGSESKLERLRGEVENADPGPFVSIGAIPQGFWSDLGKGLACAGAIIEDGVMGAALLDPTTAPLAAGILFGAGGWAVLKTNTQTACF